MRYVIVDLEGSSRAYLGSLREVRGWIDAQRKVDPELLAELLLLTYDAKGNEVANQWLSDFPESTGSMVVVELGVRFATRQMIEASVRKFDLATASARPGLGISADWSGMATPTDPGFHHRYKPASETHSRELAGTPAG